MAKIADSYFKIDPWNIVEEGFDPEYGMTDGTEPPLLSDQRSETFRKLF